MQGKARGLPPGRVAALAPVRGRRRTAVGTRLTHDQLIDQISNGTPGGGNMPAYGRQISPAEMTALVDFLENLRATGAPPAQPASTRNDEKEYP